jgi:hypothetical protein
VWLSIIRTIGNTTSSVSPKATNTILRFLMWPTLTLKNVCQSFLFIYYAAVLCIVFYFLT